MDATKGKPVQPRKRRPIEVTIIAVLAIMTPIHLNVGYFVGYHLAPFRVYIPVFLVSAGRYLHGNRITDHVLVTQNGYPSLAHIIVSVLWMLSAIAAGIAMLRAKRWARSLYTWGLVVAAVANLLVYLCMDFAGLLYTAIVLVALSASRVKAYFN